MTTTTTSGTDASDPQPDTPEVWRDGSFLVVRAGATLPDRCVKCNAPANGHTTECHFNVPKEKDVAGQLLPLVGPVDGLYRGLTARQGSARVGLCREHERELRKMARVGTGLILLGLTLPFLAFVVPTRDVCFALVLVPIGFFLGMSSASPVSAVRIERDWIWIRGASEIFLASVPELDPHLVGVEPARDDGPL
jgi:hypothetical protein